MKIGIDIDGVLCNWAQGFHNLLCDVVGEKRPFVVPTQWDLGNTSWTPEQIDLGWEAIRNTRDWWITLEPYRDNVNALRAFFGGGDDFYYVTSRTPSDGFSVLKQTQHWLDSLDLLLHGCSILVVDKPSFKRNVVLGLALDKFIDDKLETVVDGHPSTDWYLLSREWNKSGRPNNIKVVDTLEEYLNAPVCRLPPG